MSSRRSFEFAVLAYVAAALAVGVASAWIDVQWFEQVYAVEDGPIEWATAAALLAAAGVSAWTAWRPAPGTSRLRTVLWLGLAAFCLFAAGEEISWGQRVLGFSSPEFFLEHNAQRETNLHNMVVAGVKVNKLVFSQLLTACAVLFLVVLPALHRRNGAVARLTDKAGVAVPRLLHVVAIVATFAVIGLVPSKERDELLEFGASTILVLILLFPRNVAAIRPLLRPPSRGAATILPTADDPTAPPRGGLS